MPDATQRGPAIDRRRVMAAGAGVVVAALLPASVGAEALAPAAEEALAKILGGAKPVAGRITLELPEIAENGNTVPFSVAVESPMTETDYVKAIHLVATGNPSPPGGTFRFTVLSGKAALSSRIRLARTQDVIAIAELSSGAFLMKTQVVKVTIGGCGG